MKCFLQFSNLSNRCLQHPSLSSVYPSQSNSIKSIRFAPQSKAEIKQKCQVQSQISNRNNYFIQFQFKSEHECLCLCRVRIVMPMNWRGLPSPPIGIGISHRAVEITKSFGHRPVEFFRFMFNECIFLAG